MELSKKICDAQEELRKQNLDGWLFYDFRRTNDLVCHFLEIPKTKIITRRFFYWLPSEGKALKIVHKIEDKILDHLPGDVLRYCTWQELEMTIATALKGCRCIAKGPF